MATAAPETPDAAAPDAAPDRLSRVYAEALLAAAGGRAEEVGEELAGFVAGVLDSGAKVEAYLASPAVGRRAKTETLARATAGHVSDPVRGLLGVLDRNGRLGLVRRVAAAYRDLLDQRAGRVRVRVTSAVPLTPDQQARLAETLSARLGKTPVLATAVDPGLLGGLVVRVGDRVFDTSVRTRLETLRTKLLDQGTSYVRNQNQG